MKYDSNNKMLVFSTEEEVSGFHDQLTDILRTAMLNVGGDEGTSKEDDLKLTKEFFERYSVLAETLNRLRAHLPREMDTVVNRS